MSNTHSKLTPLHTSSCSARLCDLLALLNSQTHWTVATQRVPLFHHTFYFSKKRYLSFLLSFLVVCNFTLIWSVHWVETSKSTKVHRELKRVIKLKRLGFFLSQQLAKRIFVKIRLSWNTFTCGCLSCFLQLHSPRVYRRHV